jgi:CBS domain-containing protein
MRRLSDIVCDQDPLILPESASAKAACEAMRDRRAGSVLVVDADRHLVGIFTGRDAVTRVVAEGRDPARTPLAAVMTPDPATISADKTAIDALRRMWDGGFRHLPLVEAGELRACVSRGDFQGDEHSRLEEERELWEHMR